MSQNEHDTNDAHRKSGWRYSLPTVALGGLIAVAGQALVGLGAASMAWAAVAEAIGPVSLSFEERLQVILPEQQHGLIPDIVAGGAPTDEGLSTLGVAESLHDAIDVAFDPGPAPIAIVPAWSATRGILGVFGTATAASGLLVLLAGGSYLRRRSAAV